MECGFASCRFTVDRSLLNNENTKAIAFYGSNLSVTDLPLPRSKDHLWALYHEESPKNVPFLYSKNIFKHFNITSTFSRYSSMPLTVQYLNNYDSLRTRKYLVPIGEKSKLRNKLAPVVFLQSICDTMSGRNEYVKELMKYIDVDSYGKCLNNREMPDSLTNEYLQTLNTDELYTFLARYKFVISYENGVCNDYITEKFWRPLIIGSIPIYFGSPTIKDWMPNPKSVILIEDYKSPKDLANFLKKLDKDDIEYNQYLNHKYSQEDPISNNLLKKTLLEKEYDTSDDIFNSFECFICKKIHSYFEAIATSNHYDCENGTKYPKMKTEFKEWNSWESIIKSGKCEGDVLDKFLIRNKPFTEKDFHLEIEKMFIQGQC
ncbi:alpha-(1,3)-fucosyltransferase B isoform X2 [Condylostylus longicornis]|nr:alpha-(1,3)-fucosyltransferase B isoform X2 [Condylostylus longicornis]